MATLTERILSAFGGVTQGELSDLRRRAYEAGYTDGNDEPASGDLRSFGYRRQTTGNLRDFTKMNYDQIIDVVWTLFQSNPVAKRVLQIVTSHVLGSGIEAETEDNEPLQEKLDDFWRINKFDLNLEKYVFQLGLWGEQVFPVFIRESDGRVRLGYM
jgi:hypothetical protein